MSTVAFFPNNDAISDRLSVKSMERSRLVLEPISSGQDDLKIDSAANAHFLKYAAARIQYAQTFNPASKFSFFISNCHAYATDLVYGCQDAAEKWS